MKSCSRPRSEIEDEDFGVSAEDKALNRAFYGE